MRLLLPTVCGIALLIAACQPAQDAELPTLAVLPTEEPTLQASATATLTEIPASATVTLVPTLTQTSTALPTRTPMNTPTATPLPSATPTDEPDSVLEAAASATAAILEAPVFSTLTPVPAGVNIVSRPTSTGTPEILADVIITQRQFQEEVDVLLQTQSVINRMSVDVTPTGISVEITAPGETALTTGTVFVDFELLGEQGGINNVLMVRPASVESFVMVGGGAAPDRFVDAAYGSAMPIIFQAFSDILDRRLGVGQYDLEFITLTDDAMFISLIVPLTD